MKRIRRIRRIACLKKFLSFIYSATKGLISSAKLSSSELYLAIIIIIIIIITTIIIIIIIIVVVIIIIIIIIMRIFTPIARALSESLEKCKAFC